MCQISAIFNCFLQNPNYLNLNDVKSVYLNVRMNSVQSVTSISPLFVCNFWNIFRFPRRCISISVVPNKDKIVNLNTFPEFNLSVDWCCKRSVLWSLTVVGQSSYQHTFFIGNISTGPVSHSKRPTMKWTPNAVLLAVILLNCSTNGKIGS